MLKQPTEAGASYLPGVAASMIDSHLFTNQFVVIICGIVAANPCGNNTWDPRSSRFVIARDFV
ncbi:hypothetical protein K4L44_10775 [Halosquirtibacter laminarini]|uniref:Uncharacterized protein n=1 Tax=Halosquirtibacter laminarini TaxID=3374600 RepID=A0AC61NC42_9BACT|nr:hypothetical protein K4L44_10775 [Prolixibacteraceae bacterium]